MPFRSPVFPRFPVGRTFASVSSTHPRFLSRSITAKYRRARTGYNSFVKSLVLLLLALGPDDLAERHFERMKIESPDLSDPVASRVVVSMLEKDVWVGAFTELSSKFGKFREDLSLTVDFALDAEEVGRTTGRGAQWKISFNLKKLVEVRKKLDEFDRLKREGKQVKFTVPPVKMERLVYHELTHVLQNGVEQPRWFKEGMAQLVGDDDNMLLQFVKDRKAVKEIDVPLADTVEIYARGHLFWKWLESRGVATKTFELVFVQRLPLRESMEEATNKSWTTLVADERDWSENQIRKMK